ncbi:MAG: hypothetical protein M1830_007109, partial [Pleopsidium flavum]
RTVAVLLAAFRALRTERALRKADLASIVLYCRLSDNSGTQQRRSPIESEGGSKWVQTDEEEVIARRFGGMRLLFAEDDDDWSRVDLVDTSFFLAFFLSYAHHLSVKPTTGQTTQIRPV